MKTIVVTGAAGGIGAAVVRRILKQGLGVLACDQDERGLGKLVLSEESCHTSGCVLDLNSGGYFR